MFKMNIQVGYFRSYSSRSYTKNQMSLKASILEKNGGEKVEFAEYTNLIMDEMAIAGGEISKED